MDDAKFAVVLAEMAGYKDADPEGWDAVQAEKARRS